jgi:hypothetical protein
LKVVSETQYRYNADFIADLPSPEGILIRPLSCFPMSIAKSNYGTGISKGTMSNKYEISQFSSLIFSGLQNIENANPTFSQKRLHNLCSETSPFTFPPSSPNSSDRICKLHISSKHGFLDAGAPMELPHKQQFAPSRPFFSSLHFTVGELSHRRRKSGDGLSPRSSL